VANAEGAVRLVKTGESWQLPDGLPADASKVDAVLSKLGEASGGWPVATSAATAERLEVTAENHQRRVTLKAGDETVADLYLGTSPGYRKTHARHVDGDDVHAITFSNYEAGLKASDWLDKSLLRPAGAPSAMRRVDAFALTKSDDGVWTSDAAESLDQGKVQTLAGRFTGLSVIDASDAPLPDAPAMTFVLVDDEGEQTLAVHRIDEEDDQKTYLATSDRVRGTYEISSYIAEQMDVTIDDLLPDPPAAEDEPADSDADAGEAASDPAPAVEADTP